MNQSQYSKRVGRSREAIRKAVASGRVFLGPDGEINPDDPRNAEYEKICQQSGTSRASNNAKKSEVIAPRATGKTKTPPKSANGKTSGAPDDIPDHIRELADSGSLSLAQLMSLSKIEVDKLKSYEQIKQIRVKTESQRRELVSRKLIRVVFGKIYEIDQNEYLTIKDKVIPDIAAIFGSTDPEKMMEAGKRLDDELWKTLRHVQHVIDKFLKSVGDDPA